MDHDIDTRHITSVEAEVQTCYLTMYRDADPAFVAKVFGWAVDCFTGNYRDYQAIDARYHDLEHTLQGTLCMARLLRGRHAAKAGPAVSRRMFELGLIAILLHDTGYLKKRGDTGGTGAKYTVVHVARSVEFAGQLLRDKQIPAGEICSVQNMIRSTGVNASLSSIPFQSDEERIVSFALGTADLLGQMAARDYVEKLPVLFLEFEESARFSEGKVAPGQKYANDMDLMRRTPVFWEKYVLPKIERDFDGVYKFLNQPFPDGRNFYIDRIESNMEKLRHHIERQRPELQDPKPEIQQGIG